MDDFLDAVVTGVFVLCMLVAVVVLVLFALDWLDDGHQLLEWKAPPQDEATFELGYEGRGDIIQGCADSTYVFSIGISASSADDEDLSDHLRVFSVDEKVEDMLAGADVEGRRLLGKKPVLCLPGSAMDILGVDLIETSMFAWRD